VPTPANSRVDDVHVNGTRRNGAGHGRRLQRRTVDTDPVHLTHREHLGVERLYELPFSVVERADADERELARNEDRHRPAVAAEAIAGEPESGREHHAVHVARRRRLGRVEVAMRIDPDNAARASGLRHTHERAERNGVVAAEDERHRSSPGGVRHEPGQPVAEVEDLVEVARTLVTHVRGLQTGEMTLPVSETRTPSFAASCGSRPA
jgi:hypothetical protein